MKNNGPPISKHEFASSVRVNQYKQNQSEVRSLIDSEVSPTWYSTYRGSSQFQLLPVIYIRIYFKVFIESHHMYVPPIDLRTKPYCQLNGIILRPT